MMPQNRFLLLCGLILLVHATGWFNPVFTADSALYAAISKSFVTSGDWLNIYVDGKDWLDKPHFPFWVCALSIQLFGATTFAYKLPSLLFFALGLFYTWRLAKSLHNEAVAQIAVLVLATGLHLFLSNNDVRAEAILLGLVMGAAFHLHRLSQQFVWKDLLAAAFFGAAAVMTKGIFVLFIFYGAVFGQLFFNRQWQQLFRKRWLGVLLLTALFTLPELYALYQQFDLHPEKTVFGQQGVSGLWFFIWDSQFGRFFNTGPITGKGDVFFFVHTLLWAFAPWALLALVALIHGRLPKAKLATSKTNFSFFGFVPMFLLFSLSSFQLPHYTNIIFPFLAILLAVWWQELADRRWVQRLAGVSIHLYVGLYLLLTIYLGLVWGLSNHWLWPVSVVLLLVVLIGYFNFVCQFSAQWRQLLLGVMATGAFVFYLNIGFYNNILAAQSGVAAARYLNTNYEKQMIVNMPGDWLFEFYTQQRVLPATTLEALNLKDAQRANAVLYADQEILRKLEEKNIAFELLQQFNHFHTTKLTGRFLNPATRAEVLQRRYLLRLR
ncbi:MAG: glycosyltransferase family 39 protein [Bacteroidota bacterium]